MKFVCLEVIAHGLSRAPQGARGLKSIERKGCYMGHESRPARGAWIEIGVLPEVRKRKHVAPRKGRVD